jgi:hypothetical protein
MSVAEPSGSPPPDHNRLDRPPFDVFPDSRLGDTDIAADPNEPDAPFLNASA